MSKCRTTVDNSKNMWTDKTTIADLAQFSFKEEDSEILTIYGALAILNADWKFEMSEFEMEHGTGIAATFKDGSVLHVAAWGC